jgi:hypothetical protein
MKTLSVLLLFVAAFSARNAAACGACVEDKIAATYDHAVVEHAAAKGDIVVFCELKGPVEIRRLKAALRRVKGLDAASVRIAEQPPALSFALDDGRQLPEDAVAALQRAVPDTRITIIRLISSSATSTK